MRLLLIFLAASTSALLVGSAAALERCEGDIRNEHDHGDEYRFVTTSRIYQDASVHIYETCVENASDRDLDFNWYVPGPESWVPVNKAVANPRRRVTTDLVDGRPGCLRFGNDWTPGQADFLPHPADIESLEEEKKIGCDARVDQEAAASSEPRSPHEQFTGQLFPISATLEIYAPTDPRLPRETMIHVTATVDLIPNEAFTQFTHSIRYEAKPVYLEFKSALSELRIVPQDRLLRELYAAQRETLTQIDAGGAITLAESGGVSVQIAVPNRPRLTEVRYQVLARNGRKVASLFVPIWSESQ